MRMAYDVEDPTHRVDKVEADVGGIVSFFTMNQVYILDKGRITILFLWQSLRVIRSFTKIAKVP